MRICLGVFYLFPKGCRGNKLPCMLSVFSCSISVSPWVCTSNGDWKSKGHVQLKLLRTSCIWYFLNKSLLVKYFQVGPHQETLLCLPSEIPYLLCMVRVHIRYLCFINVLHDKTNQSVQLVSSRFLALYWAVNRWRRNCYTRIIVSCLFTVSFRENVESGLCVSSWQQAI